MSFGVGHYRKRPKRRAIRDDEIRRAVARNVAKN